MSALAQTSFSYAALEPEAERIVKASAIAIKAVTSRAIPVIGHHLLAAKAALPHGAFTAWTETELGINARSARNYMAAAEWLQGKPEMVADLPPTVIYALTAPGAAEVVDHVVDMANAGSIDIAAVRAKLDAAKIEQMELRNRQRQSPNLTMTEMRVRREKERKDDKRRQEENKRCEEDQRETLRMGLQPLADRLAGLGPEIVGALFAAMDGYSSRSILRELTYERLRREGA